MTDLKFLPVRQKVLIGVTVLVGLFLIVCSVLDLLRHDTLNQTIFFYSIGVPLFLLMFDTVVDLNKKPIFGIWFTIAVLTFIISLTTYKNDKFLIKRSAKFDPSTGVNIYISEYSTSSLKTLLIFLVLYWLLKKLLNKRGLFLINTFKQTTWYHDIAQRKITGLDVITNVILYATIILVGIFGR
ncbi:MAG: hypothetical protein U0U70_16650 [Chitinophagaceae bacterium]